MLSINKQNYILEKICTIKRGINLVKYEYRQNKFKQKCGIFRTFAEKN